MASNRDRALAAAITLLATEGMRALTHRRVDDRAGLPHGSTSNCFRTRDALLLGICEHMVTEELPEMAGVSAASTPAEFSRALVRLFDHLTTGPARETTAARLALIVESGHDEGVRTALVAGRTSIERALIPTLIALGAPDPLLGVQLIATCFEGLFLHVIGRHASIDAERIISVTTNTVFAGERKNSSES